MHRAVSRAVTALLILVLIIMGGLLTALMLWPDEVSSDESTGNGTANADAEIPEEIELDEEVFNSIQVLIDLWADRRMSESETPAETEEQIEEEPVIPSEQMEEETPVTIAEAVSAAIKEEAADDDIPIQTEGTPIADESPETIKDEVTSSDNVINALNTLIERWKAEERGEEETEEETEEESIEELRPEEIEESMTALESEGMETSFYSTELDEIHIAAQGSDPLSDSSSQDLALPLTTVPPLYTPVEEVQSDLSWADSIQDDTTTQFIEPVYDEDYFKDFYIQGEDTLDFVDGIYYFKVKINGEDFGDIEVRIENEVVAVSASELKDLVSSFLTAEANDRIFASQDLYITADDFAKVGVVMTSDLEAYEVSFTFGAADMPISVISLSSSYSRHRTTDRPLTDAITLTPAFFSLRSRYNLNFSYGFDKTGFDYGLTFYSSNTATFGRTLLDFSYNLGYSQQGGFDFSFGSYRFSHEFTEQALSLTVGNVYSGSISPLGTSLGVRLAKVNSINTTRKKLNYNSTITLDKESLVEVFNEDKLIFSRTLPIGNYRLEDFVLYSGVNRVLIRISPTDGSEITEFTQEFEYYASMLLPGEFYYSLSLATGRERLASSAAQRSGALSFVLGDYRYQYDIRNIAFSYDMSLGVTPTLTFNGGLSLGNSPSDKYIFNPKGKLSLEFTQASRIGTFRYNLNLSSFRNSDGKYTYPQLFARIGHQVSTGKKFLSSLSTSVAYTSPSTSANSNNHLLSFSLNASGRLGFLSWSLGGSVSYFPCYSENSSYSVYSSISLSPFRNFSLSTSLNYSGVFSESGKISASVYASYSFGKSHVSSSFSQGSTKTDFGTTLGKVGVSASVYSPSLLKLEDYKKAENSGYSMSIASYNDYFSYSASLNGNFAFEGVKGMLSVSTSTAYADGTFALSANIPSTFLLIKQKGGLKGNDLYSGYGGTSSMIEVPNAVFSSMYGGLSSYRGNSLMLYSGNEDMSFSTSRSLYIPASENRAYVYRIKADSIYTVSAAVYDENGELYTNGSSPVYRVSRAEDGSLTLTLDDKLYLFTDTNGRFVLSDVPVGTYAFDIPSSSGWMLGLIEVVEDEDNIFLFNLYEQEPSSEIALPDNYISTVKYTYKESVSSDDFWQMLYPDAFGGAE